MLTRKKNAGEQNVDCSHINNKFTSRMKHSNCKYNGNSVNWKHDWFKVCKRSYAEVVAKKVNNVSRQVENYPCNTARASTVGANKTVVTNRDTLKDTMVNTNQRQDVTCQPSKIKPQLSRSVHSKWGSENSCKGNSSKNKANDNIAAKNTS